MMNCYPCHPERSECVASATHSRSRRTSALIFLLLLTLAACSHTKKFPMEGKVVGKSASTSELTVEHGDIPGFMSAMTMPYVVKDPATLRDIQTGDKITASVVVPADGSNYWIEDIHITDTSGRTQSTPQAPHPLMPGEHVPDVALLNQDGHMIHLSNFAGKSLLVTFIYTRCPMPNFCPRLSADFAKVEAELKKRPADYQKTHLLTISFDPKYDSPEVLHKYGLGYLNADAAGFSHWDFAAAAPKDMRTLARAFGLQYVPQGDYISHTMNIVLIAPDGTVAKVWTDDWTIAELSESMKKAAHSN
jgi:protein SCO1/2